MISCQVLQAKDLDDLVNGNFEDISKTLFVIDHCFQENCDDYLKRITLTAFQKTKKFNTFVSYAKKYRVNMNYRTELCLKTFALKEKKDNLIIQFIKNKQTHMWYIDDAYIESKGSKKEILMWGFSPLSYARHFENLVQVQDTKMIENYLSLAKYGKINKKFLRQNSLQMSKGCELIYTNILVYNKNSHIVDLIFFKFKQFPVGNEDQGHFKSGWLLVDCGSMKEYYPPGKDIWIDYLLNRLKDNSDIKVNAPNDNFFTIDIHNDIKKNQDKNRDLQKKDKPVTKKIINKSSPP